MSKVFNPTVTYHSPTDGGSVNLTIDDQTLHDLANNGEVDLRFDYNESDDVDTEGRVEFVDKKKATLELESVVNFEKYFKKPRIVKPEYNSLAFEGILKASPFEPIQAGWTHFKTIWTISLASNFIDTDLEQKNVSLTITTGDLTSARLANFPKGDRLFVRCEYYGRSSSGEESSLFSSVRILTVGENPNQIAYNSIVSLLLEKDLSSGLISFPRLAKTIGWIANEEDYNPNVMDGRFLELMKFDHSVKTYFTPSPFYPISVGKTTSIKIPLKMSQTPSTSIIRYQNVYTKVNQEDKNPNVTGILFTQEDGNKNYFTSDSEKILIPNVANEFSFQLNILKFDSPALEKIDNSLFQNYFFFVTKKSTPGVDDSLFSQVVNNGVIEFGGNLREPVDFNINLNSKIAIDVHSFGLKQHVSLLEPTVNIYVGDTEEKFQHDGLINHNEITLTIESLDQEATDIQVEYYSIGKYTNDSINLKNTGVYTMSVSNVGDMTQDKKKKFKFNIGFNTNYVQEETGALELGVVEMGYMVISVVKPDKTNKFYITTKHGEEFAWSQDEDNMYHVVMIQDSSDNSKTYRIEPISNKSLKTEWSLGYYGCPTIANKKYKVIGMIFEVPNSVQSIFENIGDVSKHRFKNKFTVVYETPGIVPHPDIIYPEHITPTTVTKSLLSFGRKNTHSSFPTEFGYSPKPDHYGYFFPYLDNVNDIATLETSIPFITFTNGIGYSDSLKYNETPDGSTVNGNLWYASFQSKIEPTKSGITIKIPDNSLSSLNKRYLTYSYNIHIKTTAITYSSFQFRVATGQVTADTLGSLVNYVYQYTIRNDEGDYEGDEENNLTTSVSGKETTAEFTTHDSGFTWLGYAYRGFNYCDVCKKYHKLPEVISPALCIDGNKEDLPIINEFPDGNSEKTIPIFEIGYFEYYDISGSIKTITAPDNDSFDGIENGYKLNSTVYPSVFKIPSNTDISGLYCNLLLTGRIPTDNKVPGISSGLPGMNASVKKLFLGNKVFEPGDTLKILWKRKSGYIPPMMKFTTTPVDTWYNLIKKNMKQQFNIDNFGSFYMEGRDFIRFLRGDDGGSFWTHPSGFTYYSKSENGGPLTNRLSQAAVVGSNLPLVPNHGSYDITISNTSNRLNLKLTSDTHRDYSSYYLNITYNLTEDIAIGHLDYNKTDMGGDGIMTFMLYNSKTSTTIGQSDVEKIQFRYPSFKQIPSNGSSVTTKLYIENYITFADRISFNGHWIRDYPLIFKIMTGDKNTPIVKDPYQPSPVNITDNDNPIFQRPDTSKLLEDFFIRHKEYAQDANKALRDLCQFTTTLDFFIKYLNGAHDGNYFSNETEITQSICNQIFQHPNNVTLIRKTMTWGSSEQQQITSDSFNIFIGYLNGKYYLDNGFWGMGSGNLGWNRFTKTNIGCLFYSILTCEEYGKKKINGGRIGILIHDGGVNDYAGRPVRKVDNEKNDPFGRNDQPGLLLSRTCGTEPGQPLVLHSGAMISCHDYGPHYIYSGTQAEWLIGYVTIENPKKLN